MKDDYLIAPGSTPLNPYYTLKYGKRSKDGSYQVTLINNAHGNHQVCTVDCPPLDSAEDFTFNFPWLTWNFNPRAHDSDGRTWLSDVGTLEGHEMEWQSPGWYRDGFVVRNFDKEDAYTSVAAVVMTSWQVGRVEIPVQIIRDQNGLDEMVTMAMIAMHHQREISRDHAWDGWAKPPLKGDDEDRWNPAVAAGATVASRRSSSSSSSSASSSGKKKRWKKKLFG